MRRFLNDSSPRNMNEEPKVTPELKKRFSIPKRSVQAEANKKSEQTDSTLEASRD
jgi:hypothetical protein